MPFFPSLYTILYLRSLYMILINRVFFLILLVCPMWLIGQYSNIIHYTVKDGLPSSTTYSTVQDSKGFIWIGTDAGLVRYDGTNFKVYTIDDGLPDNEVLGLHFDPKTERMWIITYCKQACYYRAEKFYTSQNDSSLKLIKCDIGEFINGNIQKGVGEFLFNGSSVYDCSDNRIKKIPVIPSNTVPVLQVKKYSDSIYEVLTDSGLVEWKRGQIRILYPYHNHDFNHGERCKWLDNTFVRYALSRAELLQRDYFNTNLEFYSRQTTGGYKLVKKIKLEQSQSMSNIILYGDKYIISIWDVGIYTLDTNFASPLKELWRGSVNTFDADKDGNLWISTSNDGLYLIKKQNVINYSSENGLLHDNLTSIVFDSGCCYIGNTLGEIFSIKRNKINQFDLKYNGLVEKIRGMVTLPNNLCLITNSAILNFNFTKGKTTHIPSVSGDPKAILKLNDDKTILIGLIGTLITYNIQTGLHREVQLLKRIVAMGESPDGKVFGGSLDGLYKYEYPIFNHVASNDILLQSRITSLCFSPDSILWIGTPSNGIVAFLNNKVIGHITTSKYLSYRGAICRKVTAGKPNEIWVATNSGIDRIHYHFKDSLEIDNITPINTVDGLLSDDVNDILVHDSLVYIATSRGLTILNEYELSAPTPAPVYISAVKINDADSAIHNEEYDLTYKQNNLQIEYIGVSLQSSGYMRYQYRYWVAVISGKPPERHLSI
jgi:ligand-binding sensor domain-containing protein